jgi:hypothetical protein
MSTIQHHATTTTTTKKPIVIPAGKRFASRAETMAYMKIGSTRLNELLQGQAFFAVKDGGKVIIDLDSVDDYRQSLPRVGASR